MTNPIEIVAVTEQDIELVAPLFDAYRVWYGSPSDLDGARSFLSQRLRQNESVIFAALQNDVGVGYATLSDVFQCLDGHCVDFKRPVCRRICQETGRRHIAAGNGRSIWA